MMSEEDRHLSHGFYKMIHQLIGEEGWGGSSTLKTRTQYFTPSKMRKAKRKKNEKKCLCRWASGLWAARWGQHWNTEYQRISSAQVRTKTKNLKSRKCWNGKQGQRANHTDLFVGVDDMMTSQCNLCTLTPEWGEKKTTLKYCLMYQNSRRKKRRKY